MLLSQRGLQQAGHRLHPKCHLHKAWGQGQEVHACLMGDILGCIVPGCSLVCQFMQLLAVQPCLSYLQAYLPLFKAVLPRHLRVAAFRVREDARTVVTTAAFIVICSAVPATTECHSIYVQQCDSFCRAVPTISTFNHQHLCHLISIESSVSTMYGAETKQRIVACSKR